VKEWWRADNFNIQSNSKLCKTTTQPVPLYGRESLVVIKSDDG